MMADRKRSGPDTQFCNLREGSGLTNLAPRQSVASMPFEWARAIFEISVVRILTLGVLLALAPLSLTARAAGSSGIDWGVKVGSTGIGVEAALPLSYDYRLTGRLGVNYLDHYSFTRSTTYVNYDLSASLRTFDVLLDWHPGANGFTLTAGAIYNDNRVDGIGTLNRSATFGFEGRTYSTAQIGRLVGRIDFPTMAPYLGIGWNPAHERDRGWHFSSDLGVMFQGSPRTTLGIGGCTLPGNGCSLVAAFLTPTITAEARRLDAELKNYRYFPVARIGLNYRF
jgi:hypothetical protein